MPLPVLLPSFWDVSTKSAPALVLAQARCLVEEEGAAPGPRDGVSEAGVYCRRGHS